MHFGMSIGQLLRCALEAKRQTGRSLLGQFIDIARLRLHGHGVLADVYYDLRLFDPKLGWDRKAEFVGSWIKPRFYSVQEPESSSLFADKLRALTFFRAHDILTPEILAATNPACDVPGVKALRSPAALASWLRDEAPYPFFSKPSVSYRGYGNKLAKALDREADEIVFGDNVRVAVEQFAAQHGLESAPTLVFQNVMRPHPAIAALIGPRLATARFVVLNDTDTPEVFRVGLRLPAGSSMVDNFRGGASGNMLARLDPDTGVIRDVLAGIGLKWRPIEAHPDTGAPFAGFQLPGWSDALALVLRASKHAPGLKIHNWDVAFTDQGPMIIEDNPFGDFILAQVTAERGLATPRLLKLYPSGRI